MVLRTRIPPATALRDYYGKVQRWDSRAGEFLGPILLPPGRMPASMVYSAEHQRSSLERSFRDAQLLADGHVIGLTETDDGNTALEDFDASGDVVERVEYAGVPFGVLPFEDHFIVVIQKPTFGAEAVPVFETYVPSSR
jgi:hypothetical protein